MVQEKQQPHTQYYPKCLIARIFSDIGIFLAQLS